MSSGVHDQVIHIGRQARKRLNARAYAVVSIDIADHRRKRRIQIPHDVDMYDLGVGQVIDHADAHTMIPADRVVNMAV
ncbi:MAG: hypothetical protein BWX80_00357 [Candidatus Hydrogenedentes bacterium ADurb.Bin101]|nr:MAG: hypothetical protein BWX80_00357 [Candidatus Hydrogenedentes bacterium ADurb.Bin101]